MRMLPGAVMVLTVGVLGAALAGCTGERGAPGVILTGDGRILDNSAVTAQAELERELRLGLERFLGPGWGVTARVRELPVYLTDPVGGGDWRWTACTADITLARPPGDAAGSQPALVARVQDSVTAHLRTKLRRSADPVTVAVAVVSAAAIAPVAPVATPGSAPVPVVPAPAAPGTRTYQVQAGDDLATISAVHFGTSQRWRDIVAANPGLDPAHLTPGQVLVIPAR